MSTQSRLAKLAIPQSKKWLLRDRLFSILEEKSDHKAIWVSAPGGSGKTVLLASYLKDRDLPCLWYQLDEGDADIASFFHYLGLAAQPFNSNQDKSLPNFLPEYMAGLPVFTRNFFRELFSWLPDRCLVILDNYQDVTTGSLIHQLLTLAIEEIPSTITLVTISRGTPPVDYTRLVANEDLQLIEWTDILFTLEECEQLVKIKGYQMLGADQLATLHALVDGWVAGIVLYLEHAIGKDTNNTDLANLGKNDQEWIFNYFSSQVFSKASKPVQEFLIKTAFLPSFNLAMVNRLLPELDVDNIAESLVERNFFVTRSAHVAPFYSYHQLFGNFLRNNAKSSLTEDELIELQNTSADLLLQEDNLDAAVRLYKEVGNWRQLDKVVCENATILIEQSRYTLLQEWLENIPEDIYKQFTWLRFWRGVSLTHFDPIIARIALAEAYEKFELNGDHVNCVIVWCAIIDTYLIHFNEFHSVDPWLEKIELVIPKAENDLPFPLRGKLIISMLVILMNRRPNHPNMQYWVDAAWELFKNLEDEKVRVLLGGQLLIYFTWWIGDLAKAKTVLSMFDSQRFVTNQDPAVPIMFHAFKSALNWMLGENDTAIETAKNGLELAEQSGFHLWDQFAMLQIVYAALSKGDMTTAEDYLGKMANILNHSKYMDVAWYYHVLAWKTYEQGYLDEAIEQLRYCKEMVEKAGVYNFLALVKSDLGRLTALAGNTGEGAAMLEDGYLQAQKVNANTIMYVNRLYVAEVYDKLDDEKKCLDALKNSLTISSQKRFVNHPWWSPGIMSRLYAKALHHDIQIEFVQFVIKKRGLKPPIGIQRQETWPYPVKIYTMGRFSIVKDNVPLKFTTKAQKRPLELLKVLIALGGRDVAEEKITDVLWPDTEGDAAHSTYTTTLYRLRKLLGAEVLNVSDGRVSVNAEVCWLDCWAAERLISEIKIKISQPQQDEIEIQNLSNRLFCLYRGPFLAKEDDTGWKLTYRERLRLRLLRLINSLIDYYQHHKLCLHVKDLYERALEIEALSEDYYLGLMKHHIAHGDSIEALNIYARCKQTLNTVIGVEPSEKLVLLYDFIKSDDVQQLPDRCLACQPTANSD